MSASKCGQRAAKRGEFALQTDQVNPKLASSEIKCINSRCGGCYADLPQHIMETDVQLVPHFIARGIKPTLQKKGWFSKFNLFSA